jgi:uncharacterized protein YegP (UPF0339 family)
MPAIFQIKKTKTGLFTWVLKPKNGTPIAFGRQYKTADACKSVCESIIKLAKAAEVYENNG